MTRSSIVRMIVVTVPAGIVLMAATSGLSDEGNADRIRPYDENPSYWQYQGKPVLLLGGSDDDNPFQWEEPRLRAQLDQLAAVGGNLVRNTMSSRDEGNIWPFAREGGGKYDLNRPNEEYWSRFETLLRLTRDREIIVQIELWDRFDFAREPWESNPYNPANNINYTTEQSGLKTRYPEHPGGNQNRFFYSVPALDDNETVLEYQRAQVDRMLSISLQYPNVLYCMDNETSGSPDWGAYWADFIRQKAETARVEVHTTEMWDPWDLSDTQHRHTFDNPDLYSFLDISQNNHQKGQTHWDNMQAQRARISEQPRPMNNVKIYGADTGRYGTDRDGIERFWRIVFGGMASGRFHRPDSGLGLSTEAQTHIRSARRFTDAFDFPRAAPDAQSRLLDDREPNEAYLTRVPGEQYAVLFLDGGQIRLDLDEADGRFSLRWMEIDRGVWHDGREIEGGHAVALEPPGRGRWVALLVAVE